MRRAKRMYSVFKIRQLALLRRGYRPILQGGSAFRRTWTRAAGQVLAQIIMHDEID